MPVTPPHLKHTELLTHPEREQHPRHPGLALVAMLAVQMQLALSMSAAAVLAPAVAPTLGHAPESVGLYAGLGYLVAMLTGLRSGHWVARFGAVRASQAALLVSASGALLASLGPAQTLLAAAALIGAGYGVVNPAAAGVLTHHSPERARGVFFSAKQTGVPIGVALAGLLMPWGLMAIGWRPTAAGVALGGVLMAAALTPLRTRLEPPALPPPPDGALVLLVRVWRSPLLRAMSLASFSYAATQQAFVTFIVSMLKLEMGWALAAAAGVLAASQAVSAVARIVFGAMGDRWVPPGRVLVGLGAAMALGCLALGALRPGLTVALVTLVAMAVAATAMGWNGVFFAALSRQVPRQDIARVSGATQFFTFGGGMLGPLALGEMVRAGAGYGGAYAVFAVVPAAAALWLARQVWHTPAGLSGPRNSPG